MKKVFYVYIICSQKSGTLYIGVTNDLSKRIYTHKQKLVPGFTAQYAVNILVYYEQFDVIDQAISRERQLKKWNRSWKIQLIETVNPEWLDLYESL